MKKLNRLVVVFALLQSVNPFASGQTPFTFTLLSNSRTSAGVFQKDGTLVKTLWSGVSFTTGSYTRTWDNKDDAGNLLPGNNFDVRVLSNNVTYEWEGVVGNNSSAQQGAAVHRGLDEMYGMAINGTNAYYCTNYNEGEHAQARFSTTNPQTRLSALPYDWAKPTGQRTSHVATDGTIVYWAGSDPAKDDISFVFGTEVRTNDEKDFASGVTYKTSFMPKTYDDVLALMSNNVNGKITGLAVQSTGDYLFIARAAMNLIYVLNKTSGAPVRTISMAAPRQMACDGKNNLWVISGNNTISKYSVNSNGTISASTLSISGVGDPLAIAVSAAGVVAVADGNSQQVRAFSNDNAATLWTLGAAGGYLNDATVTNDKFYFRDVSNGVHHTFIAFETDGSFWVGDSGNYRAQKYNSSRIWVDRIMFMRGFYSSAVDLNDPTRVFAEYLEFKIDYAKPFNQSWILVKNWRATLSAQYWSGFMVDILKSVKTLRNGRTYAIIEREDIGDVATIFELPPTGQLRSTGVTINNSQTLYTDGSLRRCTNNGIGGTYTIFSKPLTGFDGSNNPLFGSEVSLASLPCSATDPIAWEGGLSGQVTTSSNVIVSFDDDQYENGRGNGFHLGGIKNNKWLWKTAKAIYSPDEVFPASGEYDIGNGVQTAGGDVSVIDNNIFWNYKGEGWAGKQTNKWNHVFDNGLFLGQFGVTDLDLGVEGVEAPAKMAGNVWNGHAVKVGANIYLYHNDESKHGGLHRWKVSGLETIKEQIISLSSTQNQAPIANAGPAKILTLPVNSTTLNGSGTDADGKISDYAWTQLSGPNSASFNNTSIAQPTVTGLIAGSYVFGFKVTDDRGAQSSPTQVSVTVNAAENTIKVSSLTLINATDDTAIKTFENGAVLNLASFPGKTFNVRADATATKPGSVVFTLSGPKRRNAVDSGSPFALFGNSGSDFYDWSPAVGSYSLTVTPYSAANGSGAPGTSLNISFTVVNQPSGTITNSVDANSKWSILTAHKEEYGKLSCKAQPNPSTHSFTLSISGGDKSAFTLRIFNVQGRLIEIRSQIPANSTVEVGNNFTRGLYFAELRQNNDKVTLSLIKE